VGNTFASRTVKLHNEVFYFIADFDSYKNINSKWRNFSRSDIPEGSGIFYRVPTKTTVALKIFAGNNESGVLLKDYQQEILVPQVGITRSLPRMTGYKKNQSYGIDPLTGALKTFSTSGKGLSDDETSTITSAINEVQNTRNKNLERKNKELELKLKQAELLQKLDSLKR
jgi:hypothetical protein